jgi:hypothetical protein
MSNRGSFTKITTDIILDDTIINQDIKTTANITRSKMNEAQDVLIKTGAKLQINEAADVKNVQLAHDGTDAKLLNSSGGIILDTLSGIISLLRAGVNGALRIFGSGGANYIEVTHDDAHGYINTSFGRLILSAATTIRALKEFSVRSAAYLRAYDATDVENISLNHNTTSGFIKTSVGAVQVEAASGGLYQYKSGANAVIRQYNGDATKQLNILRTDTYGEISTNHGNLILNPTADIACSNKIITDVQDLTYNAAITRYFRLTPADFINGISTGNWFITGATCLLKVTGALTAQTYYAPIHLPHGAIITYMQTYWYRDDAASAGTCRLYRLPNSGVISQMAAADSDATVGDHSVLTSAITNPTIDNLNYGYQVAVTLTPNDDDDDVKLYNVIITFTVNKPLP